MDKGLLQKDIAADLGITESCVTNWETNRFAPQLQYYPAIIAFLGYYPFVHETESIAGKLKQWRYCQGTRIIQAAAILRADSRAIRKWELKKSAPPLKHVLHIEHLWQHLPHYIKSPLNHSDHETEYPDPPKTLLQ